MSKEMRQLIDNFRNFNQLLNENVKQNKCVCLRNIKFKNGMNYFKDLTYNCEMNTDKASVGYKDGRFTTMSKDLFDKHFQLI